LKPDALRIIRQVKIPSSFVEAVKMSGWIDSSLSFQGKALQLRAQRQQLLAANIANADTPRYQAVDFDFSRALTEATSQRAGIVRNSNRSELIRPEPIARSGGRISMDGNTVDMDKERVQFIDNAIHYEATLRFLNGKLKTLLSAIQG